MSDAPLRCDLCGAEAIAVSPGMEPVMLLGFPIEAGEPRRQWCARHWPCRQLERVA